ncbi:MAG: flagellar basal body P-ring formation chaperone FlgA [Dissulfurispiraceae bacterium]|nr:flagellar basal body P-ring formation chaperone FlgA [Dissulfurispiraceae bacterium]
MTTQIRNRRLRFLSALIICIIVFVAAAAHGSADRDMNPALRKMLAAEISKTIGDTPEIISIRIMRGYDFINLPAVVEFKSMSPLVYSGKNRFTTSISLTAKGIPAAETMIEVVYDVLVDVYVASRYIQRGTAITEDDFYAVKQMRSRLSRSVVQDKSEITGKIAKVSVNEGSVILSDHMASSLTFKRGHKVSVIVEGDNIALVSSGVLKSNAVIGGAVTVQCAPSKKEVSGILISPTTVRIKI